jgi:hypothetical protein
LQLLKKSLDLTSTSGDTSRNLKNEEERLMHSQSDLTSDDALSDQRWLGIEVPSLLPVAWEEIQRHKWIESEKARHDVGQAAVADWLKKFWWRFCRWRRIEHVEGVQRWYEFSHDDFAKVLRPILENDGLVLLIVEMMKTDCRRVMDNFEVINWALTAGIPSERVIEILGDIHINVARLDPPVEWLRYSTASRA